MARPGQNRSTLRNHPAVFAALVLAGSALAYLLFSRFLVGSTIIVGSSMSPALADGDRFIINRLAPRLRPLRRGEVIAVSLPAVADLSVKRVIALPGEVVQIRDRRVYVNGRPLEEPYLQPGTLTFPGALREHAYVVASDCYFILGDNRRRSVDSRAFGAVRRNRILGVLPGAGRAGAPPPAPAGG